MNTNIYEILNFKDIEALRKFIVKSSNNRLEQFAFKLFKNIKPAIINHSNNVGANFDFLANSTLSGAPYPCSDINCRIANIENLSRFAALYADTITIRSPIDKHIERVGEGNAICREDLFYDILILLMLKPLVENGLILFTSNYMSLCKHCHTMVIKSEEEYKQKIDLVYRELFEDGINEIEFRIEYQNGQPELIMSGAERYGYQHDIYYHFRNYVPDPIKELYIHKDNANTIILPANIVKELKILDTILNESIDDLMISNHVCVNGNKTYLTDREIDRFMIDLLHAENGKETHMRPFSYNIPILANASLKDVVSLRKQEGYAFKVFRDSINSIIKKNNQMSASEWKDVEADIIKPEINKIELLIQNNKKALINSMMSDLVIWGGIITIGVFSGILPLELAPIAGAIGGAATIKDVIKQGCELISASEAARNENYYFLWRLIKQ